MNIERTPVILLDPPAAISPVRETIDAAAAIYHWRVQIGFDPDRTPFSQIVDWQPALIIVATNALPDWLIPVAANAATRRLTMLAIDVESSESALQILRGAGITHILPPEAITADELIALIADPFDRAALIDQCAQPLPLLGLKGIHEFNAREFFECHETLETAWRAESGPARNLYRVILQVGLAYYQIERGQYQGALKMFLRTGQWFAQLPAFCQGVDVTQLQTDASIALAHLESLGADRIAEFDRTLMKPVPYKDLSND